MNNFKEKYQISSVQVYYPSMIQFVNDPFYQRSKDTEAYSDFIDEMIGKIFDVDIKNKLSKYKDDIIKTSVCITESLMLYKHTSGPKVVICCQDKMDYNAKLVYASYGFYKMMNQDFKANNLTKLIKLYKVAILKSSIFATLEAYTELQLILLLSIHFLKLVNSYSISMLYSLVRNINPKLKFDASKMPEIQKYEQMDNLEVLDEISRLINMNSGEFKQRFITKFGLDYFLGFEDVFHGLAIPIIAKEIKIPSGLYSIIPKDIGSLGISING
jgi:hypothetical protein